MEIDITKTFTNSRYCFTSKTSFRKQLLAMESIQALVKTKVWQITHEDYKKLESIDSWNIFMRKNLHEIDKYSERFYMESKILGYGCKMTGHGGAGIASFRHYWNEDSNESITIILLTNKEKKWGQAPNKLTFDLANMILEEN